MSVWKWAEWIDAPAEEHRLTLGEGGTPLIRSRRIGPSLGLQNLWFKLESANPSGSYKDRFAAGAVSHLRADGKTRCVATSSGNTGASLASYCAAAEIACEIAIVEEAPPAKLKQMLAYGAELYRVRGFGVDSGVTNEVFDHLARIASAPGAAMEISAFKYSPRGMQAVQSISFELCEQFEDRELGPIEHVFCMAGGGGLTLAVAMGFARLVDEDSIDVCPKIECVQPAGNDTIAGPLREGEECGRDVNCTTKISGLQVASVVDADEVIQACRASGGTGHSVTDEEVWTVQKRLAREEGIFAEPAGSTALAGVAQAARAGRIDPSAGVVCLISGTAFKDEKSLNEMSGGGECPLIDVGELANRG